MQSVKGSEGAREVQIERYLTPRWSLKAQTDSTGASGLDVFWQRKY